MMVQQIITQNRYLPINSQIDDNVLHANNDITLQARTLHLRLLGDFLVSSGNSVLSSIDLPRMRSLFAYLVLHHDAPQERTHLAFLLWPDSTDAQALTNLRTLVHRLRHALPNADDMLCVERQSIQWQPVMPWTLDVIEFEQAVSGARQAEEQGDAVTARQHLEQAIEQYRGDLLPGYYDEWVAPERDRLRQLFLAALQQLINILEQMRDYPAAIRTAQCFLRYDSLHEETYRRLMQMHALNGDRSAALSVYRNCVAVLERELGIGPAGSIRDLYERLLHMQNTGDDAQSAATSTGIPLVGRLHEWAQMQAAWRDAASGRPHMLLLSGDAGIGKTRLAHELRTWVAHQGLTTAVARCYATERELTFAPIATWLKTEQTQALLPTLAGVWLTEIARLAPEVLMQRPDLPHPAAMTESWQRQRLFEALAHTMLDGRQPLLLVLDDMQWCDGETLAWLQYLLHFDTQARLLIIATVRPDEVLGDHPLASLLLALQRDQQITEIEVGALQARDTADLAQKMLGRDVEPQLVTRLHQEMEGNPLFIVETLRAGIGNAGNCQQVVSFSAAMTLTPCLPATVQAVIASRLAQLSSTAREIVSLASVIGQEFTFDILVQASKMDIETLVLGLDELWQRRILRERGSDGYCFTHDKLREGAYATLSSARRRLLQQRVAACAQTYNNDTAMATSSVATMRIDPIGVY